MKLVKLLTQGMNDDISIINLKQYANSANDDALTQAIIRIIHHASDINQHCNANWQL